nr:hypothetical protein L204_01925 [Cryptococcus depauperatus CBS 7855]
MASVVDVGALCQSLTARTGEMGGGGQLNVGQPSQAEIISALTSQSAIPRTTPTIPFPSSSAPLLELTNVGLVDGLEEKANNRKLYRSRDGYGSVILRAGLGR